MKTLLLRQAVTAKATSIMMGIGKKVGYDDD